MKDKIISEIQAKMASFLSSVQQEELRQVLMHSLRNAEITDRQTNDTQGNFGNGELLKVFIY